MSAAATESFVDLHRDSSLDVRMVAALAGDRNLNARESQILDKLKAERGEALYADMLYTLTHRSFPARQAKHLWGEIAEHRRTLQSSLGRDPGISLTAHDYLINVTGLLKNVSIIEESKLAAIAASATHDGLTGLVDNATFKHLLKEELERQTRYGGTLSLVMLDIDHFKQINDTFGHSTGDEVLAALAEIIQAQARKLDTAARYGGEEFAVILPEVEQGAAAIFAERLRQAVEQQFADSETKVTISLGIASSQNAEMSAENLVKAADAALYDAKKAGRNKVCQAATGEQQSA